VNRKRVYGNLSTLNKSVNVDKGVNKTFDAAVRILQNPGGKNTTSRPPLIVRIERDARNCHCSKRSDRGRGQSLGFIHSYLAYSVLLFNHILQDARN